MIMGTCFGQLNSVEKRHKRLYRLEHTCYRKNEDKVELHFLVEEEEQVAHIRGTRHRLLEVETEPADEADSDDTPETNADVQLVTLDVRSLQHAQQTWQTVTPPSSVDLEWENDGTSGNILAICHRRLMSTTEECSTASALDGSPAESLEWDSCDNNYTALDTDTEQLLCEIESLTQRALRETGFDWAYR